VNRIVVKTTCLLRVHYHASVTVTFQNSTMKFTSTLMEFTTQAATRCLFQRAVANGHCLAFPSWVWLEICRDQALDRSDLNHSLQLKGKASLEQGKGRSKLWYTLERIKIVAVCQCETLIRLHIHSKINLPTVKYTVIRAGVPNLYLKMG